MANPGAKAKASKDRIIFKNKQKKACGWKVKFVNLTAIMLKTLLLTVCLAACSVVAAQQFGGHPPSTRWQQINTDSVRVIFPAGLQRQAAEVTGIIHRLGRQPQGSLGTDFHKISIVLQPKTTISNGYVGLGPWRSEFQLTPPQNSFQLGSLSWHRTLALHEYRHVEQYNNFRKGISRAFYYLFGQQGQELVNSAAIPNWFWEGDAVFQETILSEQGRGRLPSFFNGYRSLWAADKSYSWMKLRNGSYRDYIPDHYRLGYMLVAYGREKYGADLWRKVTDDAARFRGLFYPFQRAIRKHTGQSYTAFRTAGIRYFQDQFAGEKKSPIDTWAQAQKHFAGDDAYPQWIDDHRLVLVNSSYKKIPAFYTKDVLSGKTNLLRVKDISLDDYFSYRNGRIVYAAYEPDARWRWKDYSVIKWLDVANNEQRTLTHKSHYFSPDISEDGTQIVAVQVEPGAVPALHLLNGRDGSLLRKLPNPDQLLYTFPKFYDAHHIVSAVRNVKGEMALCMVNTGNDAVEYLTPWVENVIGYPAVHKDTITFTASNGNQDHLFVLVNKKLFLFIPPVASEYTGQYQLNIANGRFAWTAFTAAGNQLQEGLVSAALLYLAKENTLTAVLSDNNVNFLQSGKTITIREAGADTLSYPVSKYSAGFGLLNFHSWRPFINDPDYTFSILSDNVLNTLQSEIYFNYNNNEKNKELGVSLTYAQLFPWVRLGTNYTIDRPGIFRNKIIYFNEWKSMVGLVVPLNFSSGRHNRFFTVGSDIGYRKRFFQGTYKDTFDNRGFGYWSSYASFSNQSQQARQHIYPRWAQTLQLNYTRAVSLFDADQFLASAYWYFPGIDRTHNFVINTAFHQRDTMRNATFSSSFPFSRGYVGENFYRMWKVGGNYHLPLVYPDWGVGNIAYLLRVRANLFYDFTRVTDRLKREADLRSYGTEIFFDTKWWNQHNITFGFRYSRLLDPALQGLSPNQWEFILPVNLLGGR